MTSRATIKVYKCPSCNGALRFDEHAKSLSCIWCDSTYDVANLAVQLVRPSVSGFLCPECGAHLMTEEFVAATTCPYCGNNEVASFRYEGEFEPDLLIPFTVSKKEAILSYENVVASRCYLPNDYADEARVVSVMGAYVPFWLQSGTVNFDYTYVAYRKENKVNYVYNLRRRGTYDYARVPADASDRMPDDVMDSIEPYDYASLVPYDPGYLPGFMAERYTVGADDINQRVNNRVAKSACFAAMSTIGREYDTKYPDYDRYHASVFCARVEQVLLPVWLIIVAYGDKKYTVGVNGQTGKVAVNLPVDEGKQRTAALVESLKAAAKVFAITLAFLLLIFVVGIGAVGLDGMLDRVRSMFSADTWAHARPMDIVALVTFVALFLFFLIGPTVQAFLRGWRKVMKSMHNVKKAVDADAFDIDGLNVTASEFGQGPSNKAGA